MLKGLDVSSVQGKVPWAKLAAMGYRFALIKAQQGNDGCDPEFVRNVTECKAAGIEPLAYCFAYPLQHIDPAEQARLFVASIQRAGLSGRPFFIDCEWPEIAAWTRWGCSAVQISTYLRNLFEAVDAQGERAGFYSYPVWEGTLESHGDLSWLPARPLWIADYRKTAPIEGNAPRALPPWARPAWTFWQWDGNGGQRLPTGADSDFDVFNGDEADLQALLKGP